jgi:ABC-type transport system involved in multi-copper enzyme maturation permease subunit
MRWGPGPVFVYECVTNARRWQTYGARSFAVAVLLLGMVAIAWANDGVVQRISAREYARLGECYFYALIGLELSLVMLAAPAATAGAICIDRARGTLTHILVTDLSDTEIVAGKLVARLLPVLGLVACTWPVMAISSLLGGIDPVALTMAFAVIIVVAVLGCSLALALSVWARKPHEVVALIYTFWAVDLLAYPVMWALASARLSIGPPRWLLMADPLYLALASYTPWGGVQLADFVWFIGVALGASAALLAAAILRMRPASSRVFGQRIGPNKFTVLRRPRPLVPPSLLDRNPVVWREWQRGEMSGWVTAIAGFFRWVATAACIFGAYAVWAYGTNTTNRQLYFAEIVGLLGGVLVVSFGLLSLSAVAPMSLSEERQQSSLDVLVVTPLSTRSIVLGKWLGVFRLVPGLTIGPGLVVLALATVYDRVLTIEVRLFHVGLLVATILVHGALITSVGVALATWVKHQSRAISLSVCSFLFVSLCWPITAYALAPWRYASGLAALSPITATALLIDIGMIRGDVRSFHFWVSFWDVMVAYGAFGLFVLTVHSFDRCFGRMPERVRRSSEVADVVVFSAGGIAIACAAGAVATWLNHLEPQSLSFEGLIGLASATIAIMVVLSMLAAVATFSVPLDGSDHAAPVTMKCWWRAARLALALALGPGLIALSLATAQVSAAAMPSPIRPLLLPAFGPLYLGYRLINAALLVATIFVQGAVISVFSLALKVWTKRRDRAITLGAGLFLVAAIGWPLLVWHFSRWIPVPGLSMLSFLAVSISLAAELVTREPQYPNLFAWAIFRIIVLTAVTVGLLWRTKRTLDQRIPPTRAIDHRAHSGSTIVERASRPRALVRKVP